MGEIGAIILYSQRRKWKRKYERVGLGPLVNETMNNDDDAVDDGGLNSSQSMATMEEMNLEPPTLGNVITSQAKDGNDDENDACLETSVSSLNIESLQQMQINAGKQHYVTPRCKYCAPLATILCNKNKSTRWWSFFMIRLVLVIALNLLLVFTISFSAISLMEINSSPSFKESMESLTPQCSDPNLVCPAANEDIERESTPWNSIKSTLERVEGIETTTKEMKSALTNATGSATQVEINPTPDRSEDVTMPPFSYLIASDAQLYWFNGEFAEMGLKNIPSSCSPTDSCGKCTGKHGYNVNTRLKKAWESLMIGETDGMDLRRFGREDRNLSLTVEDGEKGSGGDLPVPDTLIMNGALIFE